MIQRILVIICDICGEIGKIEEHDQYDQTSTIPDGWNAGRNDNIHICPSCSEKLGKNRPASYWPEGVR